MTTDIIIPHYGGSEVLTRMACVCLGSIRDHSKDYRVILVDNGSPDLQEVREVLETLEDYLLIRNTINQGFIRATNQGLWASTAPYVVFLNNDTQVVPRWLEKLRGPLLAFEGTGTVGVTGPRTTTRKCWQGRRPQAGGVKVLSTNMMLAFFCTMFRREVLEAVGDLNEDYGVGFGDDDEYCHRVHKAGLRLALVQDLVIPHGHRTTFKHLFTSEQIIAQQQHAMRRFRRQCLPS